MIKIDYNKTMIQNFSKLKYTVKRIIKVFNNSHNFSFQSTTLGFNLLSFQHHLTDKLVFTLSYKNSVAELDILFNLKPCD